MDIPSLPILGAIYIAILLAQMALNVALPIHFPSTSAGLMKAGQMVVISTVLGCFGYGFWMVPQLFIAPDSTTLSMIAKGLGFCSSVSMIIVVHPYYRLESFEREYQQACERGKRPITTKAKTKNETIR